VRVFALIAEWISGHSSFAFDGRECIQRPNNCTSLAFIDCTFDYTLSDRVFCIFDAPGQFVGVRFEDRGIVQFHPLIIIVHGRLLSRGWEKGTDDD